MAHVPWLRVLIFALPPALVALWLSIPAFQPDRHTVQGRATPDSACLLVCSQVIEISGLKLACDIDFLGVPYPCPEHTLVPAPAVAEYIHFPSLAGLFGLQPTTGTLVRLKQQGQLVFSRPVTQQIWSAMYGGWVFNSAYWAIAGIIIWLWPRPAFRRRAASLPQETSSVQPKAIGDQLLHQRIRNRIIETLEWMIECETNPLGMNELVNTWEDWVPAPIPAGYFPAPVFSEQEKVLLMRTSVAMQAFCDATPNGVPNTPETLQLSQWRAVTAAARQALQALMERGRMPEDRELTC